MYKKFITIQDEMKEKEMQNLNEFIKNERKWKKILDNKKRSLTTAHYWTDDPYEILKEELEKRRAKYSILSKSPFQ